MSRTPEDWEWGAMTSNTTDFENAVTDLASALAAHDAVNATFKLATCGWVLGPLPNRTIFDEVTLYKRISNEYDCELTWSFWSFQGAFSTIRIYRIHRHGCG